MEVTDYKYIEQALADVVSHFECYCSTLQPDDGPCAFCEAAHSLELLRRLEHGQGAQPEQKSKIERCQFRVPPENMQCELAKGHKLVHLAGMYFCPVEEPAAPPEQPQGESGDTLINVHHKDCVSHHDGECDCIPTPIKPTKGATSDVSQSEVSKYRK